MSTLTYNRGTVSIISAQTVTSGGSSTTSSATLTSGYLSGSVGVSIAPTGALSTAGNVTLLASGDNTTWYTFASISSLLTATTLTVCVPIPDGTVYVQSSVGSNVGSSVVYNVQAELIISGTIV